MSVLESIAWSNAFMKDRNSSGSPWNSGMSLWGKHDNHWSFTSNSVISVWRFITLYNSFVSLFWCHGSSAGVELGLWSARTFSVVAGGLVEITGLSLCFSVGGDVLYLCWPWSSICWLDCDVALTPSCFEVINDLHIFWAAQKKLPALFQSPVVLCPPSAGLLSGQVPALPLMLLPLQWVLLYWPPLSGVLKWQKMLINLLGCYV